MVLQRMNYANLKITMVKHNMYKNISWNKVLWIVLNLNIKTFVGAGRMVILEYANIYYIPKILNIKDFFPELTWSILEIKHCLTRIILFCCRVQNIKL